MSGETTTVTLKQRMTLTDGELRDAAMALEAKGFLRNSEVHPGEKLVRVVLVLEVIGAPEDSDQTMRSFDRLWDIARSR